MLLQIYNFNFINGNYKQFYVSQLIPFFCLFPSAQGNIRVVISVHALHMHNLGHYTSKTPRELLRQIL